METILRAGYKTLTEGTLKYRGYNVDNAVGQDLVNALVEFFMEIEADSAGVEGFIFDANIDLKEDLTEEELKNLDIILETPEYVVSSSY